jgi:hypothetical protein
MNNCRPTPVPSECKNCFLLHSIEIEHGLPGFVNYLNTALKTLFFQLHFRFSIIVSTQAHNSWTPISHFFIDEREVFHFIMNNKIFSK